MNISDIVDKVAAANELNKAHAKKLIDSVLKSISEAALSGEEVSLPGFGKFKVKDRPARTGRNPQTGQTMEIAASKNISFVPAKAFKDALNAA